MALSSWSDGYENFSYPQNGPVSPAASGAGSAAGVAVGNHRDWPVSEYGDEASRSLDFHYALKVTANTVLPVIVPLDQQYNNPPYQASRLVMLSMIRVHINLS